jgi:D-sedoheptulose 7-phosphate isomerase
VPVEFSTPHHQFNPSQETSMTDTYDVNSYFGSLALTAKKLQLETIDQVGRILLDAYHTGRMVFLFGNGGSAALASHFACDLGKGTVNGTRKRFRVLALTDNVPLMTAWANDSSYEDIFAEQLVNLVRPNDVAFAISGSGNSPNVLHALRVAREAGAITVGLGGFQGGKMKELCDVCMIVPSDNMQIIEDLHMCTAHALFTSIRQKICHAAGAVA